MSDTSQNSIIIVGAGIVGVSAALWLQRLGQNVTLVDKTGPAAGASHGNAGVLAVGAIVPVTVPGLLKKAPRMLLDPKEPLFLRWSYLPRLFPFLRKYLANTTTQSVERTADGLNLLLHDSPDQHFALAQGTDAERYFAHGDYLFGYANEAKFKADAYTWDAKTRRGVKMEPMSPEMLAEYDPNLRGRFGFGVRCRDHGVISDPGEYVAALAKQFENNGGKILQSDVSEFVLEDGRCTGIRTSKGVLSADKYIIAAGAWSGNWAKHLGVKIPLESERGYHIEFVDPSITLRAPIMVASGKFVVNSMNNRMRCAGIVEFGGLDAPASAAPFKLLRRQMAELFPDLTYSRIDEWMGHRPTTADSLPVIGVAPNANNVWLGYGHHHVGLTGGPKTGRWLADMVTDTPINADLSAFSPARK